jgi:hypothetical protein
MKPTQKPSFSLVPEASSCFLGTVGLQYPCLCQGQRRKKQEAAPFALATQGAPFALAQKQEAATQGALATFALAKARAFARSLWLREARAFARGCLHTAGSKRWPTVGTKEARAFAPFALAQLLPLQKQGKQEVAYGRYEGSNWRPPVPLPLPRAKAKEARVAARARNQ